MQTHSQHQPHSNQRRPVWLRLYQFAGSLQLAVIVIISLALSMAGATFLESAQGTRAVQEYVYQTYWFGAILVLLGINIFFVALHRYPWKRSQLGFLFAPGFDSSTMRIQS